MFQDHKKYVENKRIEELVQRFTDKHEVRQIHNKQERICKMKLPITMTVAQARPVIMNKPSFKSQKFKTIHSNCNISKIIR